MKNLKSLIDSFSTAQKLQDSMRINIPSFQLFDDISRLNKELRMLSGEHLLSQFNLGLNLQQQIKSISIPQTELSQILSEKINMIKGINIPNIFSLHGNNLPYFLEIQNYLSSTLDLCTHIGLQNFESEEIESELSSIIEILPKNGVDQITRDDINAINIALQKSDIRAFYYFIIPIIITLIITYYTNKSSEQVSSISIINTHNQEDKGVEKEFSKTLEILCLEQRIAKVNAFVKSKPLQQSAVINNIKEGQIVFVQQIRHKWLYIIYQDSDYMIKSGWVLKKQFKKDKIKQPT